MSAKSKIRAWRSGESADDAPSEPSKAPRPPKCSRRRLSSVAVTVDRFADRPRQPADRTGIILLGKPLRPDRDSWAKIS